MLPSMFQLVMHAGMHVCSITDHALTRERVWYSSSSFLGLIQNSGKPIRKVIKVLHSSAVRYGEIFHSPYLMLTRVISLIVIILIILCAFLDISSRLL